MSEELGFLFVGGFGKKGGGRRREREAERKRAGCVRLCRDGIGMVWVLLASDEAKKKKESAYI